MREWMLTVLEAKARAASGGLGAATLPWSAPGVG